MKNTFLPALLLSTLFIICCSPNDKADEATCRNIQQVTLSSNGPVTIGQTITFSAPEVGGNRIYNWRGPHNFTSDAPANRIDDAELENEGWYHLVLSGSDCNVKADSVYIDVKLQQGTPSCTVGNNTCQFTNLANDTYATVRELFHPTYNFRTLRSSGTSTLDVMFHPYWNTREPEDGIYRTVDVPVFGPTDNNYNKLIVNTTKNSIYFASNESQNVYVSHVNGKLQVRFCSLVMGGYNGASFTTQASATNRTVVRSGMNYYQD